MANRIKGITVEIGGDTTKLSKALDGVNKNIRSTQTQLKDVEKLLKLDPTNTELLAQKQKLLADSVSATKEKLKTLKTAAEQANGHLQTAIFHRNNMMPCSVKLSRRNRHCSVCKARRKTPGNRLKRSARRGLCLKQLGAKFQDLVKNLLHR